MQHQEEGCGDHEDSGTSLEPYGPRLESQLSLNMGPQVGDLAGQDSPQWSGWGRSKRVFGAG